MIEELQTPQVIKTPEKQLSFDEKNILDLQKATSKIKELSPVIDQLVNVLKTLDTEQSRVTINDICDNAIEKINILSSVIKFLPEKMEQSLTKLSADEKNVSELQTATSKIKELSPVIDQLVNVLKTLETEQSQSTINNIYDKAIEKINILSSVIKFLPEKMEQSLTELLKRHDMHLE